MIKTIRIKIDNELSEEVIFKVIKDFILLHFSINTKVDFEVSGKEKTIRFDMQEYKKNLEEVSKGISKGIEIKKNEEQKGI